MNEEFILIKTDSHLTIDPSRDTRYVILISGNIAGSFTVKLTGEKRHIHIIGLMFGKHDEKIDFSFVVRHLGKNTKSTVRVSAFAAGRASLLVKNDVRIERRSFGSTTDVTQWTLRLSPNSRVRSIPMIGMDHENLTASHGVVIDGYDRGSLGYLQSRGIALSEAKKMVAFGLFRRVSENVSDPVTRQTLYNEWEQFS